MGATAGPRGNNLDDFKPTWEAKLVHIDQRVGLVVDQRISIRDLCYIFPAQGVVEDFGALLLRVGVGLQLSPGTNHDEVVGNTLRGSAAHLVIHLLRLFIKPKVGPNAQASFGCKKLEQVYVLWCTPEIVHL